MGSIREARKKLLERVLEGEGEASREQRRAALEKTGLSEPVRALVQKVAEHAYRVTDEDIAAVRAAGLSENQIFELVVCAAIGQSTRQHDAALAALEAAAGEADHAS